LDEGIEDSEEDDGSDIGRISKGPTILKRLGSAGFKGFETGTTLNGLSDIIGCTEDFFSRAGVRAGVGTGTATGVFLCQAQQSSLVTNTLNKASQRTNDQ
jgi:hypothetical protein